jgi:hypothetical protein
VFLIRGIAPWFRDELRSGIGLGTRRRARFNPAVMLSRNAPLNCLVFLAALLMAVVPVEARLGETEAQSQQRYGPPAPELSAPTDKPLVEGAKEVIYNFQGWRVRAAFVAGATMRIEYVHLPENSLPKKITEDEIRAILDGEKATFTWREDKPRTGNKDLNALKAVFDGRRWERSDHATASLKFDVVLVLETRDADAYDKKAAKQPKAVTPVNPGVPKF